MRHRVGGTRLRVLSHAKPRRRPRRWSGQVGVESQRSEPWLEAVWLGVLISLIAFKKAYSRDNCPCIKVLHNRCLQKTIPKKRVDIQSFSAIIYI